MHFGYFMNVFAAKTTAMNTTEIAIMTSGLIFGPFVSASKNLIIPMLELGPETPGSFCNLTIEKISF